MLSGRAGMCAVDGRGPTLAASQTLAMVVFFGLVGACAVYSVNSTMKRMAREDAADRAVLIMDRYLAVHAYFNDQLKPRLFEDQSDLAHDDFDPHWMSSTFAVRSIDQLAQRMEDGAYYYKECAVNARSPGNEATGYEADYLRALNSGRNVAPISEVREINGDPYFVVLREGETMAKDCLQCHGVPSDAPAELVARYGPDRSFGRQVGDIVSAISIRVPLADAYRLANTYSSALSVLLLLLLAGLFVTLNVGARLWLIRPLRRLRDGAMAIADGSAQVGTTIDPPRAAELHDLTLAFNRMSMALREREEHLETLVAARTAELSETNLQLKHEIRERERTEAARQSVQHSLERARRLESLGTMAGGLAHELNNTLQVVLGHVELLQDAPLHDTQGGSLESISHAAQRAADLARRMLACAGDCPGGRVREAVKVAVTVQQEVARFQASPDLDARCSLRLERDIPSVMGDPDQLGLVVRELLDNARDGVASGGEIRVRLDAPHLAAHEVTGYLADGSLEPGRWVLVEVSDDGVGMTAEEAANAFEPFYTTKSLGRGLGLAMVWGIVRAHGGAVRLVSAPNEGTAVSILLPPIVDTN
ncbi:MAG: DUF3365 domain-containing protein [Armatimonadia bacterium]|nr:DUF3365 domain-containing protein [Armatimonadia bacterium]